MIRLEKVNKNFAFSDQKVKALCDLDLHIKPCERVAITGKSGAGKSTLLSLIGTLDRPSSGKIILDGQDITSMNDRELSTFRNKTIGFVFQMNNLLKEFSALENVMMPGFIAGSSLGAVEKRAKILLESVGLSKRMDHRPSELSGGEQQRVAVARSLLMAPAILLADEPTGNLDGKTGSLVEDLLFSLCDEHKITMLLVTHDERLASKMPKKIVMEDGFLVS